MNPEGKKEYLSEALPVRLFRTKLKKLQHFLFVDIWLEYEKKLFWISSYDDINLLVSYIRTMISIKVAREKCVMEIGGKS